MTTQDNNRLARALYVSGQAAADWLVGGSPLEIRCPVRPKWFKNGVIEKYRYNFESCLGTPLLPISPVHTFDGSLDDLRARALNQAVVAFAGVAAVFAHPIDGEVDELAWNCALDDYPLAESLLEPACTPEEDILNVAVKVTDECNGMFEGGPLWKCVDELASRLLQDGIVSNEQGMLDGIIRRNLNGLQVEKSRSLLPWPTDTAPVPSCQLQRGG